MTYKTGSGNYRSSSIQVHIKEADQTINTETTLQNDTELKQLLRANTNYSGTLLIFYVSPANADLDISFTDITGATADRFTTDVGETKTLVVFGTEYMIATSGATDFTLVHFTIKVGATAGTLQFQFAQTTSQAGNTTIKTGSCLTVVQS